MGLFTKRADKKEGELSFLGHIEALRWHLVRSVLVIITLAGFAFAYPEIVFTEILRGPSRPDFFTYRFLCECSQAWGLGDALCFKIFDFDFQFVGLMDAFTTHMWVSIVAGLVAGFPFLLWELWRFVKPALQQKEINAARGFIFYASVLFLLGVAFAYWIVTPMAVYFLGNYQIDPNVPIHVNVSTDSYISVITTLVLLMGLVFELPIVMYFLGRFGIITAAFLRKYRKHALIVILIVSAVITPTTDVFTQALVAFPLWILFEASIIVVARVEKKIAV
ncbi:MAG TPA: twin-arginine translocase subunit TatC [Bacteroidia bacterium]|nr:twin-arginine translocase subunit TatC [Bacteroidia bacterium]